jgi:hypothetical protein
MTNEMMKKLKENERPLFVLQRDEPEMVEAIKAHLKDVGYFNGESLNLIGSCSFDGGIYVYRLRPDYVEPPKERWFVSKLTGKLMEGRLIDERDGNWLEIKTPEELAYVKNRPEGCRFGMPKLGCEFKHAIMLRWFTATDHMINGMQSDFLSGYRWIKEPKEVKPVINKEIETLIHEMFVDAEKKLNNAIRARFEVREVE